MVGKDDESDVRPLTFVLPPFMTIEQFEENQKRNIAECVKKERAYKEKKISEEEQHVVGKKKKKKMFDEEEDKVVR